MFQINAFLGAFNRSNTEAEYDGDSPTSDSIETPKLVQRNKHFDSSHSFFHIKIEAKKHVTLGYKKLNLETEHIFFSLSEILMFRSSIL